ncbi:MAG: radical SAM protein [Deltaproteobacteria bacterium]|nr:MAG: radical SAM protein [Deltaproteobacteria bacterium]
MNTELFNLLKKYDVAGPRYTSYPTAPAWTADVTEVDYKNSLAALEDGDLLSLYLHIPFCENLCHFCGCMKMITTKHEVSAEYTLEIIKEIERVAALLNPNTQVNQLHFGGGSPNFLQPQELKKIVDTIRSLFKFTEDAEIAIEMHPRTSTKEFCDMVARLGFNRISLGLQDLDPKVQKLINRHQTFEMTRDMVELLRNLGLKSFNFDLIYGLPGQSLETWKKDIGSSHRTTS